jgi:hypothetical protein
MLYNFKKIRLMDKLGAINTLWDLQIVQNIWLMMLKELKK